MTVGEPMSDFCGVIGLLQAAQALSRMEVGLQTFSCCKPAASAAPTVVMSAYSELRQTPGLLLGKCSSRADRRPSDFDRRRVVLPWPLFRLFLSTHN